MILLPSISSTMFYILDKFCGSISKAFRTTDPISRIDARLIALMMPERMDDA